MVPGIIVTVAVAAVVRIPRSTQPERALHFVGFQVQYTSLVLWRFCLAHPEVRDVCDIGQILFGGSKFGYYFTAVMFILNNTFIQGTPPDLQLSDSLSHCDYA